MSWPDLTPPDRKRPLTARLGWMAVYWALSVAALGLVAFAIRWWLVG